MILSIANPTTQDIFDGLNSKAARKLPKELHARAKRLLDLINSAKHLEDLKIPPGNKLEKLKGSLKEYYSIRINDQWRIIFKWQCEDAASVRIIDYH